jgi:Ca2+-binding RTX toxin-like protein
VQQVVFEDTGRSYTMAQLLQDIGFDLDGTAEADFVSGTSLNDRINTFEGDDAIATLGGDDVVNAGAGNDEVTAPRHGCRKHRTQSTHRGCSKYLTHKCKGLRHAEIFKI